MLIKCGSGSICLTISLQIPIKDNVSNQNQDQKQLIAKCTLTLYVSIYLLCIQKVRNSTVVIKIKTVERVHHTLWSPSMMGIIDNWLIGIKNLYNRIVIF